MIEKELKTSTKTRVAIVFVAILMLFSTVALYIGLILSYNNSDNSSTIDTEKQAEFEKLYMAYQEDFEAQTKTLSDKYFDSFKTYASSPKAYNAAAITEVSYTDIVVGTGDEILEGATNYSAYYIGWLSDGTVFDSSFDDYANPSSLSFPLPGGDMIEGWNEGVVGMKIGGVREISMPAELAYGSEERGEIPANSPLKFVLMLVDREEQIDWTEEMYELYAEIYDNN